MVIGSIIDFHAAEDDEASDDESFALASGGIFGGGDVGLVGKTPEDRNALGIDIPGIGDANLCATKDAVDLDGGFIAFDFCVTKVEFDASKDGSGAAAFEVLTFDTAFAAAEDG